MDTTWGNMQKGRMRENTNAKVYRRAKEVLKEEVEDRDRCSKERDIERRSTYEYRQRLSRESLEQQRERLRIDNARHWAGINRAARQKRLQQISVYYTLGKLTRKNNQEPAKAITLDPHTLKPIDYGQKESRKTKRALAPGHNQAVLERSCIQ